MPILSDNDRADVWTAFMRATPTPGATKPQLRAAINAADVWCDSSVASWQAALPVALRTRPASDVLLANVAAVAAGRAVADVAAGVVDRSQSGVILAGYTAGSAWFTAQVAACLTAIGLACGGTLTQAQSLAVVEAVSRKRAGVQ